MSFNKLSLCLAILHILNFILLKGLLLGSAMSLWLAVVLEQLFSVEGAKIQ